MKQLAIGAFGTLTSLSLAQLSHIAAICAGFGTFAWMVTQIVLAIRNQRKK